MPGRSRRTLGRWIRICCTVSHLPGQPPIPWGRWRMGSLEAEDGRDTRAGLDSWTRASLRPAGGQPPPVILDDTATSYGPPTPPSSRAWACSRLHSALRAGRPRPGSPRPPPTPRREHDKSGNLATPASQPSSLPSCVIWLQPGPVGRLFGNGTNPGRRGASPEGACRVECCCAATRHPKVLPAGWVRCRGSGPAGGPGSAGSVRLAAPSLPQDVGHMLTASASARSAPISMMLPTWPWLAATPSTS